MEQRKAKQNAADAIPEHAIGRTQKDKIWLWLSVFILFVTERLHYLNPFPIPHHRDRRKIDPIESGALYDAV
jgi:hypothetical protein